MKQRLQRRGFTTFEILCVLIIIGLLAWMIIPNVPAVKRMGEDSQMKNKAIQLNTAMTNFMQERTVRAALKTWQDHYSEDGEALYADLRPYIQMPTATLGQYLVEGYTVKFPSDPRGEVVVLDPDGKQLEYH